MLGALAAAGVEDAITTGITGLGATIAAIGAAGVGLSMTALAWPKGVAFFKKVLKL